MCCSLPPGVTDQPEVTDVCLVCKKEFIRDVRREVPIAAVPACSVECTRRYDDIVRKSFDIEKPEEQLPSTSRRRGGGTPVPLPRVSISPSSSEVSAPPESETPLTPKEETHVAKSVRMSVIE